jgi:hypothetical protein
VWGKVDLGGENVNEGVGQEGGESVLGVTSTIYVNYKFKMKNVN